jgi:hypothetical protein
MGCCRTDRPTLIPHGFQPVPGSKSDGLILAGNGIDPVVTEQALKSVRNVSSINGLSNIWDPAIPAKFKLRHLDAKWP